MKRLSVFFPLIMLFTIIGLWIYEINNNKNKIETSKEKNIEVKNEKNLEKEQMLIRSKKIVESFISENDKFLQKDYFDKTFVIKNDKKIEFLKLSEITKATAKLQKYKNIKNDFKKAISDVSLDIKLREDANIFANKINNLIDKEIANLYKIFGTSIHPMDKMFLDKFHD